MPVAARGASRYLRDSDGTAGLGRLSQMTEPERCRTCGDTRELVRPLALAWSRERRPDGTTISLCDRCARTNLRAIEARLPEDWW